MTVTTESTQLSRVQAPESRRLDVLMAALDDPALIGFRGEILDAIEELTGVRPEVS